MKRFFRTLNGFFSKSRAVFINESMKLTVESVLSVCLLLIYLTSSKSEFSASIDDDDFVCDCLKNIESEDGDGDGDTMHSLYCSDYGKSNVS